MNALTLRPDLAMFVPRVFSCNSYLLHGKENALIDPGCSDAQGLLSALQDFELKPEDIERVYYTHMHFDHIGHGHLFPKARHYMHELDAEHVNNKLDQATYANNVPGFTYSKITDYLKGGEKIKVNHATLKAMHAPGHTAGSTCFFDEENSLLFSGDVIFANNAIGRYDLYSSDPEQQRKTVKEMQSLPWKILLSGHGEIEEREL